MSGRLFEGRAYSKGLIGLLDTYHMEVKELSKFKASGYIKVLIILFGKGFFKGGSLLTI